MFFITLSAQDDSGPVQASECMIIPKMEGIAMLTHEQIERLPRDDQAVVQAAQAYYCGLLMEIPRPQRQLRLEAWWRALRRRWPDICCI